MLRHIRRPAVHLALWSARWGITLILVIAGLLAALPLLTDSARFRSDLCAFTKRKTGATLSLRVLRVGPLSGTPLRIEGLSLTPEGETRPVVSFDRLLMRHHPLRLLRREVALDVLELINPTVHLDYDGTRWNFEKLLPPGPPRPPKPPAPKPPAARKPAGPKPGPFEALKRIGLPVALRVGRIGVENLNVSIRKPGQVTAAVRGLTTRLSCDLDAQASGRAGFLLHLDGIEADLPGKARLVLGKPTRLDIAFERGQWGFAATRVRFDLKDFDVDTPATGSLHPTGLAVALDASVDPWNETLVCPLFSVSVPGLVDSVLTDARLERLGREGVSLRHELKLTFGGIPPLIPERLLKEVPLATRRLPALPPLDLDAPAAVRALLAPPEKVCRLDRRQWRTVHLDALDGEATLATRFKGTCDLTAAKPAGRVEVEAGLKVALKHLKAGVVTLGVEPGTETRSPVRRLGADVLGLGTDFRVGAAVDLATKSPERIELAGTVLSLDSLAAQADNRAVGVEGLQLLTQSSVHDFPGISAELNQFALEARRVAVTLPGVAQLALPVRLSVKAVAENLTRLPASKLRGLDARLAVGEILPDVHLGGDVSALGKEALDVSAGVTLNLGEALKLASTGLDQRFSDRVRGIRLGGTVGLSATAKGALPSPDAPDRKLAAAAGLALDLDAVNAVVGKLAARSARATTRLDAAATFAGKWEPADARASLQVDAGETDLAGLGRLAALDLKLNVSAADRALSSFKLDTSLSTDKLQIAGQPDASGEATWLTDPLDLRFGLGIGGSLPKGDIDLPRLYVRVSDLLAFELAGVAVRDMGAQQLKASLSLECPSVAALLHQARRNRKPPVEGLEAAVSLGLKMDGKLPLVHDYLLPGFKGMKPERPKLAFWPVRSFARTKLPVAVDVSLGVKGARAVLGRTGPLKDGSVFERRVEGLDAGLHVGFAPDRVAVDATIAAAALQALPELGPLRDARLDFHAALADWDVLTVAGPNLSFGKGPVSNRISVMLYGLSPLLETDPATLPLDTFADSLGLRLETDTRVDLPETLLPGAILQGGAGLTTRVSMVPGERVTTDLAIVMDGLSLVSGEPALLSLLHGRGAFKMLEDRKRLAETLDREALVSTLSGPLVVSLLDDAALARRLLEPVNPGPGASLDFLQRRRVALLNMAESDASLAGLAKVLDIPRIQALWTCAPVGMLSFGAPRREAELERLKSLRLWQLALSMRPAADALSAQALLEVLDQTAFLRLLERRGVSDVLKSPEKVAALLKDPAVLAEVADPKKLVAKLREVRGLAYATDGTALVSLLGPRGVVAMVDEHKLVAFVNSRLKLVSGVTGRIPLSRTMALSTTRSRALAAASATSLSERVVARRQPPAPGIDWYVNGVTVAGAVTGLGASQSQVLLGTVNAPPTPIIDDLNFLLGIDQSRLVLDRLRARLLDGKIHGQLTLLPVADVYRLFFWLEFTNINFKRLLPERLQTVDDADARINGSAEITLTIQEQLYRPDAVPIDDIQVRIFITRIGRDALDRLLLSFDPTESNPGLVSLRGHLKLARPSRVSLVLKRGLADVDVELQGLAAAVIERQSVRYIPVAKMLQQDSIRRALRGLVALQGLLQKVSAGTVVIGDDHKTVKFE